MVTDNGNEENGDDGNGNGGTENSSGGNNIFRRAGEKAKNLGNSAVGGVKKAGGYVGNGFSNAGSYVRNNKTKAALMGGAAVLIAGGITAGVYLNNRAGTNPDVDKVLIGQTVATATPSASSLEQKTTDAQTDEGDISSNVVVPTNPPATPYGSQNGTYAPAGLSPTITVTPYGGTATSTPAPTSTPVPTLVATVTPVPTSTAVPTRTPAPTSTAVPTRTPAPTSTPVPEIPAELTIEGQILKTIAQYDCFAPSLGLENKTVNLLFDGISNIKGNSEARGLVYNGPDNTIVFRVESNDKLYNVQLKELKSVDPFKNCLKENLADRVLYDLLK